MFSNEVIEIGVIAKLTKKKSMVLSLKLYFTNKTGEDITELSTVLEGSSGTTHHPHPVLRTP